MIVDSSALLALIRKELESANCYRALLLSPNNRISAGTLLEASLVVDGLRNAQATSEFEEVISGSDLSVEPITLHQVGIAREAYRRFGKGSGHRARLNFGIASPTRWRRSWMNRSCSLAMTLSTPTFVQH